MCVQYILFPPRRPGWWWDSIPQTPPIAVTFHPPPPHKRGLRWESHQHTLGLLPQKVCDVRLLATRRVPGRGEPPRRRGVGEPQRLFCLSTWV
ncbi:uncharacterized protein BDZ83DRAFT_113967 [Colletotrichum acutatum]|uniref:Uncharacterized protein n=1 Tax=Glomerella acutata TaxID=27357 RepID=A0AAD8UQ74_GLOAC|nr:uncharacterized protein BDZ83DRAFT_113967 [Colletotrichum acutatum]KAK1728597.1 hypothetical protein BDZ83DRAFT_113967 [Colletotrichum acutatum]